MAGGSAPPAPDYAALTKQQGEENRNTANFNANLNRVNQVGPNGSSTWSLRPGADPNNPQPGDYIQTVSLGAQEQAQYDQKNAIVNALLNKFSASQGGAAFNPYPYTNAQGQVLSGYGTSAAPGQAPTSAPAAPQTPIAQTEAGKQLLAQGLNPALAGYLGGTPAADYGTTSMAEALKRSGMNFISSVGTGDNAWSPQVAALKGQSIANPPAYGSGSNFTPMAGSGLPGAGSQGGPAAATGTGFSGVGFNGSSGGNSGMGLYDDNSRRRVEEALMARLQPQYEQDEARLRNQLLAQGLEVGTAGYNSELDRLSRAQNDARMQAVLAGGQEETRQGSLNLQADNQQFNQNLQSANFNNALRGQMLAEYLQLQNLPLQQIAALSGVGSGTGAGSGGLSFGSYPTANAQTTDYLGAGQTAYNQQLSAWNAQQQGNNALLGSLAGLGGTLGSAMILSSDERLKTNLKRIGTHPSGVDRYTWDWKDGSGGSVGVIAQELQKVRPDAVLVGDDGYLRVNYTAIGGA